MVLVALRPHLFVISSVTLITLASLVVIDGWPTTASQQMAVVIFLFVMFLLWRNHHRTVTVTRELADSAVILAEELNLLIDGAQDYAISMLDPDGHVTIWNEGRSEARRVGKGCVRKCKT